MAKPPPFRIAGTQNAVALAMRGMDAAEQADESADGTSANGDTDASPRGRVRFFNLDAHLHCSVIGTCLSTAELRKLMARFIEVDGATDLDVHHEAVRLASQETAVAKALSKALDRRHDSTLVRFARARDTDGLAALWEQSLQQGDVPGAYWAVLTSRLLTPQLRQRVFGDVHMLSHLVGAANRADIRRLVALENENAELQDKLERQQTRFSEVVEERNQAIAQLREQAAQAAVEAANKETATGTESAEQLQRDRAREIAAAVALHTARRERAERAAAAALEDADRSKLELDRMRRLARELTDELAAAETQLHELSDPDGNVGTPLSRQLRGRSILYVGGRPSSTPAIRDLVVRHGGEFRKHDGGLEDRKGLLASAVAWAELVLFPVDCIDHDSAAGLKRTCVQLGIRFVPLRSASVASFASAIGSLGGGARPGDSEGPRVCPRHG